MENGENRAADSVKLFVGQLPKQMNEQQLAEVFSEAGTVYEINIIKDKLTKQSRGMRLLWLSYILTIFFCWSPTCNCCDYIHRRVACKRNRTIASSCDLDHCEC